MNTEYTLNQNSLFEYHDLIEAIVLALEKRDVHTLHHSVRVSNMTHCICEAMGLTGSQTELYHIAADLHDIGKIGVRDAVLLKQGALDAPEWAEMRMHAPIGGEILSKVERFQTIANIVRAHHERWDGKGYPDGLSGKAIPLGARIIAVADSIDAMLSDRAYRKALPESACKEEIRKNAEIMYDPDAARAVADHWDAVLAARIDCGKRSLVW